MEKRTKNHKKKSEKKLQKRTCAENGVLTPWNHEIDEFRYRKNQQEKEKREKEKQEQKKKREIVKDLSLRVKTLRIVEDLRQGTFVTQKDVTV